MPKTLIFAKNIDHASNIEKVVREKFKANGDKFCQKIVSGVENVHSVLRDFKKDTKFRITVTVDMITTGVDVKALECLIFLRDIRSKTQYLQMRGRGTRTLDYKDLKKISPSATHSKDRFVIVDAVGVTKAKLLQTRTLDHYPSSTTLGTLMDKVSKGIKNEKILLTIANRLSRLNHKMTEEQKKEFIEKIGISISELSRLLLDAFDKDLLLEHLSRKTRKDLTDWDKLSQSEKELIKDIQKKLINEAIKPFQDQEKRNYIEKLRNSYEQLIDTVNQDKIVRQEFQRNTKSLDYNDYQNLLKENRDKVLELLKNPQLTQLKELCDSLKNKKMNLKTILRFYKSKYPNKVNFQKQPKNSDLISFLRFEEGLIDKIIPFSEIVEINFINWLKEKDSRGYHFSDIQMEWLQDIKRHITISLSIFEKDLDRSPFDNKGNLGKFYEIFGDDYQKLLDELSKKLII